MVTLNFGRLTFFLIGAILFEVAWAIAQIAKLLRFFSNNDWFLFWAVFNEVTSLIALKAHPVIEVLGWSCIPFRTVLLEMSGLVADKAQTLVIRRLRTSGLTSTILLKMTFLIAEKTY